MASVITFIILILRKSLDTGHQNIIITEKLIQQEATQTVTKALLNGWIYKTKPSITPSAFPSLHVQLTQLPTATQKAISQEKGTKTSGLMVTDTGNQTKCAMKDNQQ